MAEKKPTDPNMIHNIATGYMGSCVLFTALELNVFDELSGKSMSTPEVAEALSFDASHMDRLLVALTSVGLLERVEGKYSNAPVTERYMVKSSPSYFGDYYRFQVRRCLMPDFLRLDELIKENRAFMADDWSDFMSDREMAGVFILGQHSASQGGGRLLARKFDFTGYRHMVDLAGGSGACSIAACRAAPGLKSVIVDFPNVLPIAEEIIAKEGLSDRISTQPGDITKDDWPTGDLMLISLIMSTFAKETQMQIFRKCYDKLTPGGAVIVHDFLMNEDYTGPVLSAMYNVTAVAGVPTSGKDMAGLLQQAGFVEPVVETVIPEYTGMVAAKKP